MDVYLRSVIEINPEAIELAEIADMERESAGYVTPCILAAHPTSN